jgi:DHA1 family bicyclomycin/chloramphenicol resistance-like MFS transporter
MVQDLFEGDAARAKRSYVATIFTGVPILAPAVGSLLIGLAGWRSVHAVLAILGTSLLAITWFFVPESRTVPASTRHQVTQGTARAHIDIPFLRFAVANALSYGVIFVYIASSPIVMVRQMGYSTVDFAGVFACTAAALAVGAWTNGRLSHQGVAPAVLVNPAFISSIAATLAMAFVSLARATWDVVLLPLLMIVLFARGILAPNLQHLAIERRRERAGTASAVVGVSQLLAGAAASATVAAMLPAFGLNAVTVTMALLGIAAFAVWCPPDG